MNQQEAYSAGLEQPMAEHGADDNLLDLVKQLTRQGSHLAEQQLALIKAEVRESAADVKTAVGGMLGAAVVGIAGLGVTLMGLAYLLADALDNLGLATLIVGGLALLGAYLLYSGARSKMDTAHLTPDRTQRTLERTPDTLRGDLHSEHKP
ncbi:MAG: phage holin family protein [Novosphingobium sp.]|nr:phage holin family protein [Novosphingobium sp.]